jgi:hypothetical protein
MIILFPISEPVSCLFGVQAFELAFATGSHCLGTRESQAAAAALAMV